MSKLEDGLNERLEAHLTATLAGKVVSRIVVTRPGALAIHFVDGVRLVLDQRAAELSLEHAALDPGATA